jgi:hypothetical protein
MINFLPLPRTIPFVVQQVGSMVQIKPYASYYVWLDWFDLEPLDFSPAIDVLTDLILGVNDIAVAAAVDASQALADASNAQSTADDALAAASNIISSIGRFTLFWDEALLIVGTRTISRVAGMDYGHGVSAAGLINNEMRMSFSGDISRGGIFHFHVVTNNASGIMRVLIDAVEIGTVDLYTAVQALNVDKQIAVDLGDFTTGRHRITLKSTTKHASSTGYFLVVTKVWFSDGDD